MQTYPQFNDFVTKTKTFSKICTFVLALSHAAHAQTWSTLGDVTVPGSRDMAYDHQGKQLYVTTDAGAVQVFTLPTRTANGSIQVGTNLKGIDISPDRTKLAVGNSDGGRISIISLPSRVVTHYSVPATFGSGSTHSCVFIDNNTLVVGGRVLNLTAGTFSSLGYSFYGEGIVSASASRNAIGFTEPGISSGTAGIYDPVTKAVSMVASGWFTYDVTVSPSGNQIVVPTYSGSFIYDKVGESFSKSATIGDYASWWGRGAAYSPYQDHLFVSFSSHSSGTNFPGIVAYNSKNLSRLTNVESSSLFLSGTNSSFSPGHLKMAANGRYLFAITSTGVRIYDVSNGKRSIVVTRNPATGGVASGNGLVNTGSTVNMSATPNPGWLFTGWKGSRVDTAATFSFTASDDAEFEANFAMDLSDADGDTLSAFHERTVSLTDPTKADSDGDLSNDNVDLFPNDSLEWADADLDGRGDNSDTDDDNDGVADTQDAFPLDAAASRDTDLDGKPDELVAGKVTSLVLDSDDDNDGYADTDELAAGSNPKITSNRPSDHDGDFISDVTDADDDNDLVADISDAFAFDAAASVDTDQDGKPDSLVMGVSTSLIEDLDDDNDLYPDTIEIQVGTDPIRVSSVPADYDMDLDPDLLDGDDDNDGYSDANDAFPYNRDEWGDNDGDHIGDNADQDDDNDGYLDEEDPDPNTAAVVIGKYFGMISADEIITGGHGGTIELIVGKKGKVSGVIRMANGTLRFRGSVGEQEGPIAQLIVNVPRRGFSPLRLELSVGSDIAGNLSGGNFVADIHGWKQRYGPRDRDTTSVEGSYNLALTTSSSSPATRIAEAAPLGYGYANMKIVSDGSARVIGKLADGSIFTAACPLGPEGQVGIWHQKFQQWSILGEFELHETGHLNGQIDWRRLPSVNPRASLYPSGFQNIFQVSGSRLTPATALSFLTSWSGPGNAQIIFEGADIENTRQDPSMIFEVSSSGETKLPKTGSAANPTSLALQISKSTGLFKGECTLLDLSATGDLIQRKVRFEGIVTDQQATGFFLLESLPTSGESIKLIRSGCVKILPTAIAGQP